MLNKLAQIRYVPSAYSASLAQLALTLLHLVGRHHMPAIMIGRVPAADCAASEDLAFAFSKTGNQ